MASFTSFGAVAASWAKKHNVLKARDEALLVGATMAKEWAKEQYGGGNTAPPTGAAYARKKGHNRPLYETGALKAGVLMKKLNSQNMIIYQKDDFLGIIHELGSEKRNIPARVIWGRAKVEIGPVVMRAMITIIKKHLTN